MTDRVRHHRRSPAREPLNEETRGKQMSFKFLAITPALAMGAAAAAIALGAPASADPGPCTTSGVTTTVCESPGSASVVTEPSPSTIGGGTGQNGSYGPAGNTPPVGHNN